MTRKRRRKSKNSQSLSSAIFGNNTAATTTALDPNTDSEVSNGSILEGIFGNENHDNDTIDLFSTSASERFKRISEERSAKNKHKLLNDDSITIEQHHGREIEMKRTLQARKNRTSLKRSIDLVNSITIPIPHIGKLFASCNDNDIKVKEDKEEDVGDVQRGILRLFVIQSDAIFRENGVLIMKSNCDKETDLTKEDNKTNDSTFTTLFPNNVLQSLCSKSKEIEQQVCQRLDEESIPWNIVSKPESTIPTFKYHEVASRCLGRMDIRYGMNQSPFNSRDVILNPFLLPFIQSVLGQDAKLVYAGLILSFPASVDQPWHQDGKALFEKEEMDASNNNESVDLPPYALNIFIPLDDVTEEVGPTEFWLGSHKEDRAKEIMQRLFKSTNDASATSGKKVDEQEQVIGPLLKVGDALIYDYRVCHRGTQNLSCMGENCDGVGKTRPMLYLMYSRPWFYEHVNFGTDRLFPREK